MLIDLLRHGETEADGRLCGSTDCYLTTLGEQQLWEAVSDRAPWDLIATSPKHRCADFAQALAERVQRPCRRIPDFAEVHFGAWENRQIRDLAVEHPVALAKFWADPGQHPPPEAEPLYTFIERVEAALSKLHTDCSEQHVLLVTHGGPIRYLLCRARGLPLGELLTLHVPYAARVRLRVEASAEGLLSLTEVA